MATRSGSVAANAAKRKRFRAVTCVQASLVAVVASRTNSPASECVVRRYKRRKNGSILRCFSSFWISNPHQTEPFAISALGSLFAWPMAQPRYTRSQSTRTLPSSLTQFPSLQHDRRHHRSHPPRGSVFLREIHVGSQREVRVDTRELRSARESSRMIPGSGSKPARPRIIAAGICPNS